MTPVIRSCSTLVLETIPHPGLACQEGTLNPSMQDCEYCGHPLRFHKWVSERQRPECQVELGDEWASGYSYRPDFEPNKEKICRCFKVREVIVV